MKNKKQTNNNTENKNSILEESQDVTYSGGEAVTELSQSSGSDFTLEDFYDGCIKHHTPKEAILLLVKSIQYCIKADVDKKHLIRDLEVIYDRISRQL